MFIPHLQELEKSIEDKNMDALEGLLSKNNRIQNRTLNFKSALMLSAHNLKHLLKIDSLSSECIILNLEDGVSKEQKPIALRLAAYVLSKNPQSDKKFVVRVNPLDEGGKDEILFLNAYKPDAIRVPKIKSSEDVKRALSYMDENIELHLSIETKEAWKNLKTVQVDNRVKAIYLGILDLFADLGFDQTLITPKNPTMHYILAEFIISAKIINAYPVSFVYQDYKNIQELEEWLKLEKMMGYTAKGCVSPTQSDKILEYFALNDEEIARAKYIVELFEKMREQGITGFADERYGFIDEPIYKGALKTVNKAI